MELDYQQRQLDQYKEQAELEIIEQHPNYNLENYMY